MQDIPYGCCHCGCGEKTKIAAKTNAAQHQRKGQPNRYLAGHRAPKHPDYLEEDRGYSTPCWIWQGAKDWDGYGLLKRNGKPQVAHGWYYTQANGPIPDGLELDHLCRVRNCVNPDHLEAIPHAENVQRGASHRPPQTHCKRGHPFDAVNTYHHPSGSRICRACRRTHDARRRRGAEPKPDSPQFT